VQRGGAPGNLHRRPAQLDVAQRLGVPAVAVPGNAAHRVQTAQPSHGGDAPQLVPFPEGDVAPEVVRHAVKREHEARGPEGEEDAGPEGHALVTEVAAGPGAGDACRGLHQKTRVGVLLVVTGVEEDAGEGGAVAASGDAVRALQVEGRAGVGSDPEVPVLVAGVERQRRGVSERLDAEADPVAGPDIQVPEEAIGPVQELTGKGVVPRTVVRRVEVLVELEVGFHPHWPEQVRGVPGDVVPLEAAGGGEELGGEPVPIGAVVLGVEVGQQGQPQAEAGVRVVRDDRDGHEVEAAVLRADVEGLRVGRGEREVARRRSLVCPAAWLGEGEVLGRTSGGAARPRVGGRVSGSGRLASRTSRRALHWPRNLFTRPERDRTPPGLPHDAAHRTESRAASGVRDRQSDDDQPSGGHASTGTLPMLRWRRRSPTRAWDVATVTPAPSSRSPGRHSPG
jgi:hypothetical protein